MLVIRDTQIDALGQSARAAFEQRMTIHLRRYFPDAYALIPGFLFPIWLGEGIARARELGLESERHICKFLSLAIVFGARFTEAPHLAWMRAMLVDPAVPHAGDRMDRLYTAAIQRLRADEKERSIRDAFRNV